MANERLLDFPAKPSPVSADIVYVGDSADSFNEVQSTIGEILSGFFGTPLSLARGGTNAALTAVNGGVVYSTASALAISAAGSAGQLLRSAGAATPTWTTTTYPVTNAINTIMYASSANVLGVISALASAVLISSAGGVPAMSQTLPSAVQTNITSLGAQAQALDMNSHLISNVTDPVSAQDAATRAYVLSVAQGRVFKDACVAATTGDFSATYANGASGIGATLTGTVMAAFAPDGVTLALGDRVLFKDQSSSLQRGIYVTSVLGTGSVLPVFTRATDMDQPAEFKNGTTFISGGTLNQGRTYTETATVTTVGTDPVTFVLSGDSQTALSVVVQTFTSGSSTYTPTPGMQNCTVEIAGGGGGAGGGAGVAATSSGMGGGGGGAGYCRRTYTAALIGANAAIVVGAGGAGGAAGNNNGSNGNDSTFTPAGAGVVLTAAKGSLGSGMAAVTTSGGSLGGAGGTGTNGDINIQGGSGNRGAIINGASGVGIGGDSGPSYFSPAQFFTNASVTGATGTGYGGGGQGGFGQNADAAGGAGSPGYCIITEYIVV